jgi:hypothetical protein
MTASPLGELPKVRSKRRLGIQAGTIGALILLGMIICALSGCGPTYSYPDYPASGYAPYSWGWGNRWGYDPVFVVHHPWEEHHDLGHHTEFYHSSVGHEGGGFHGGGEAHGGGHR